MTQTGIVKDLAEAFEKVEIMFTKVVIGDPISDGTEHPYVIYTIGGPDAGHVVQAWYDCMLAAMSRTTRQLLVWRLRPVIEPHPIGFMIVSQQWME
jgi:hypothetical protein